MQVRIAWPLTGRVEEMRVIQAAIFDPDSSGIILCGSAGVGKSRLAREALVCAASKGSETRWAAGTSSARQIPLGAFASWAGQTATDTIQLVGSVIDGLTSVPAGTPVVVGVDDAQPGWVPPGGMPSTLPTQTLQPAQPPTMQQPGNITHTFAPVG